MAFRLPFVLTVPIDVVEESPSTSAMACPHLAFPFNKSLGVCMFTTSKNYLVCAYRPPDQRSDEFLHALDECIETTRGRSVRPDCILGDFNAKSSSWWQGQPSTADGIKLEITQSLLVCFKLLMDQHEGSTPSAGASWT